MPSRPRPPRASAPARAPRPSAPRPNAPRTHAPRHPAPPPPGAWSVAVGAAALAVYVALTPQVSGDGDASEFALVLARLGLAHPTGYPLYTFVGHAFVTLLHALGGRWDWAANVWSAVGGAVAIGLLHAFAARLLARAGVPARAAAGAALLPAAAFGLNPMWTQEATLAEVNSWHVAWTAGAALLLERTLAALAAPPDGRDARRAAAWGLLAGAGLAHHLTSVLTLAPFTLALLLAAARAGRLRPAPVAAAAGTAALPLLSYAYVFWRAFHPADVQWPSLAPDWRSALAHVTGAEYRLYLGRFAPTAEQVRLLADYAWPWLGPAGLAALAWAARARAWPGALRAALAGALVANVAYALDYGVPDPAPYFLAPLALALAIAPAAALAWAPLRRAARPAAGVAAAALAVAAVLWVGTGRERARTYARFDALLHAMWTSIPYPRGFVVWSDDMAPHLREYQLFAGEKPGLEVLHPLELTHPWPRREFMARHGFDPVSDAAIRARAERERPHNVQELSHTLVGAILTQINARSPLPVVEFLPEVPSVRLLVKAGAADSAGAARAGDAAGAAGAGR